MSPTRSQCPSSEAQVRYSPAESAATYHAVAAGDTEPDPTYSGPPTPAVDQVWEELYLIGVNALTQEDMRPFLTEEHNTRQAAEDGRSASFLQLGVFHSLHCLNNVRMLVWPEYYGSLEGLGPERREELQGHLS
ncbi:hypothetical protein F4778DRAFT_800721 [Xylariomycetidae sp. FL2044]|nr:hypothetical protein F4778DRAFT_800721 [Xylariomycetidae sp. FL2044]